MYSIHVLTIYASAVGMVDLVWSLVPGVSLQHRWPRESGTIRWAIRVGLVWLLLSEQYPRQRKSATIWWPIRVGLVRFFAPRLLLGSICWSPILSVGFGNFGDWFWRPILGWWPIQIFWSSNLRSWSLIAGSPFGLPGDRFGLRPRFSMFCLLALTEH